MSEKQTSRELILGALLCGERLSKLQILRRFGCWNSGNIVYRLRREGYDIQRDMVTKRKKTFAEYYLPVEAK